MTRIATPLADKLGLRVPLTGKLREAAVQAGKPDFIALWAGQAAPLARAMPAAELIRVLEEETLEAIRRTIHLVVKE